MSYPQRAILPRLGPENYQSYTWRQPLDTHFHPVSCAEYHCQQYEHGWSTTVDLSTELGQKQAHYIEHDRSRKQAREQNGTLVTFTYPPGQQPFAGPRHEHRRPVGYDPLFLILGGDFRGNPRRTPAQAMKPEDWIDSFRNHQDRLARAQQ